MNKLNKELLQIVDGNDKLQMQKRMMWVQAAQARNEFIDNLRMRGIKGKRYSDEVVAYDSQNQVVWYN